MAWIKMRTDLRNHPKVVRMASALKADRLRVVGGLYAVWGIFDTHSEDGRLEGYTLAAIDEDLGWKGFAAAMESVCWLIETAEGIQVPEFDEHNGASAKRRAQDTKLKKGNRSGYKTSNGSWIQAGHLSGSDADNSRTREREEKEKKEYIPPKPPTGVPAAAPPDPDLAGKILKAKDLEAEGIPAKAAADWLAVRKAKRAPLTTTAWARVKLEAAAAGMTPAQAVQHAAENGWQGFKAAWLLQHVVGHGSLPAAISDQFAGAV